MVMAWNVGKLRGEERRKLRQNNIEEISRFARLYGYHVDYLSVSSVDMYLS